MKMLVLNASPKKKGKVAGLLSAVADGARGRHDIEWIDVYGLSIKPCLGCMKCRPDKPCALPRDDAHVNRGKDHRRRRPGGRNPHLLGQHERAAQGPV